MKGREGREKRKGVGVRRRGNRWGRGNGRAGGMMRRGEGMRERGFGRSRVSCRVTQGRSNSRNSRSLKTKTCGF